MNSTVGKELQRLTGYIETLAAQRDEARRQLRKAQEEAADLRNELKKTLEELHKARLDVEYLTISHKLAENPQAVAQAREAIKGMVRRVDKAIALLKSDARI